VLKMESIHRVKASDLEEVARKVYGDNYSFDEQEMLDYEGTRTVLIPWTEDYGESETFELWARGNSNTCPLEALMDDLYHRGELPPGKYIIQQDHFS
jgi:hypothetical protein